MEAEGQWSYAAVYKHESRWQVFLEGVSPRVNASKVGLQGSLSFFGLLAIDPLDPRHFVSVQGPVTIDPGGVRRNRTQVH